MKIFVYEHLTAIAAGGDGVQSLAPSLLREGQMMRAAIVADFARINGVTVDVLDDPLQFDQYVSEANATLLIAPETDQVLTKLAQRVVALGATLLNPTPAAIDRCTDKYRLYQHWAQSGVATPKTWLFGEQPATGQYIIKPRDGAGSQATHWAHLPSQEDYSGPMIAQEFVPGVAASVAFLIGQTQQYVLPPRRQVLSDDGYFHYRHSEPLPTEYHERAIATAQAALGGIAGLFGYVGVDLVVNDSQGWAIEINPRLTSSYLELRQLVPFNIAQKLLEVCVR